MTLESAMNAPINHPICDACETVAYCASHGCIPVEEYDPGIYQQETLGVFGWLLISAVILVSAACIAFAGYSLWPSVVAAWSGL